MAMEKEKPRTRRERAAASPLGRDQGPQRSIWVLHLEAQAQGQIASLASVVPLSPRPARVVTCQLACPLAWVPR